MKRDRKEEISLGHTYPRRPIVIAKNGKKVTIEGAKVELVCQVNGMLQFRLTNAMRYRDHRSKKLYRMEQLISQSKWQAISGVRDYETE